MKSFRPKDEGTLPEPPAGDRYAEVDFHGQRLSNDTHRSITDPEARLYRKGRGREAKLSFMGHALQRTATGSSWTAASPRPTATPSAPRRWHDRETGRPTPPHHARSRQGL